MKKSGITSLITGDVTRKMHFVNIDDKIFLLTHKNADKNNRIKISNNTAQIKGIDQIFNVTIIDSKKRVTEIKNAMLDNMNMVNRALINKNVNEEYVVLELVK